MLSLIAVTMLAAAPKVASPPWSTVDVKPELASFYAEQLAQSLRNEGLSVTTAGDIATLLGAERQRELLGCSSAAGSCMAELANALGCDATLTVNLARLGTSFRGLARLLSSRDGAVLSSVTLEARDETELLDRLSGAAKTLAGPLVVKPASTKVAPSLWWLPGAVGVAGLGASAALLQFAAADHAQLTSTTNSDTAAKARDEGQTLQAAGFIVGGVGAAAVLGSLAWLAFGSTEVQPTVAITPGGATVGVGGKF
jgi:hypothetical protein